MGGTQSQPVPVVPRVSISYGQPALTSPGASMLLPVTVANDTSEELPAQRLQLQGDAYWQNTCSVALPPIAPYSECEEVVLQMRCHNNLDPDSLIASLPAYFTLQLDVSKITQRCSLSFWTYTQGLRDYSPATLPGANGADKFVLLAFGLAGSGKSSFYNSVQTLMQKGNRVATTVPSGGTAGHKTVSVKRYSVESANFELCDTWGIDRFNTSYMKEQKILEALLEGWLPTDWKMMSHLRGHMHQLAEDDASQHTRKVHGVLFFITAAAVHDNMEFGLIRDCFQQIKSLGYTPIVVLSQADTQCKGVKINKLGDHPALSELKHEVAVALGIADNSITHCVSYTDSTSRSFEIDRLTYKILDMVLHNASDFCSIPQPLRSLQNVLHGDWEEDMRE